MLDLNCWKTEARGVLSLEDGGFRLVVRERSGTVLFLVMRHSEQRSAKLPAIVASGVRDSVKQAMIDAEKVAARLMSVQNQSEHGAGDTRNGGTPPVRDDDAEQPVDEHRAVGMSKQ